MRFNSVMLTMISFFWVGHLHATGTTGGDFSVVNAESITQIELTLEQVNQIRANVNQELPVEVNAGDQWKTLTTFTTSDGREGFVVESSKDKMVHTITKVADPVAADPTPPVVRTRPAR
ncbi:MAG: hypothetical protein HRU19_25130 [Pseudobacteriovorax sp.]|nr:hypothetical protein [Pseudobacteriovorax sp.]